MASSTRSIHRALLACVTVVLGTGACATGPASATPQPPPIEAAQANDHPEDHHLWGMPVLFASTLSAITLRPDQAAIVDSIESELRLEEEPTLGAWRQICNDVADAILAGAIDHSKIDPEIERLIDGVQANRTIAQDAVNRLHDALDHGQRARVAARMRANAEAWQTLNQYDQPQGRGSGADRIHALAEALGLSSTQEVGVRAAVADSLRQSAPVIQEKLKAVRGHAKTVASAFEADTFDARTVDVAKFSADMARLWISLVVGSVEAVLRVVPSELRARFASRFRQVPDTAN